MLEIFKHGRFPRDFTEHQMLHSAAHDGVENGIPSVSYGIDLDHLAVGALTIILGKFTEWTLWLPYLRQQAPLKDDLRMRGNPDAIRMTSDHFDRPSKQRAGNFHFVLV